jgi:hypothetical protein
MKKIDLSKQIVLILALLICFPMSGFAGWRLYDDFSSGSIDNQKWGSDSSSLSEPISVENGAAKFVLDTDVKNDSAWLNILESPEKIKGIRAKVKFASRVVGVRGRIGGYLGTDPIDDLVWTQIALQQKTSDDINYRQYVWYSISTLDPADFSDIKSYLYGEFPSPLGGTYVAPIDLTDEWITIEIQFNPKKFSCGLPDPDMNWYLKTKPLIKILKVDKKGNPDLFFKGIGVRANNSAPDGEECIVYFDDVYIK